MRAQKNIKALLKRLIDEKYDAAKAAFWAGSVAQGDYTPNSDLDLVIVFDNLPNAYREAFIYEGWRIDAFIHDGPSLRYFFEKCDRASGILALPRMVVDGIEILEPSDFSKDIKVMAQATIAEGPPLWSKEQIDKERFFITDKLDDILAPKNRVALIASAAWLFEALAQFYLRAKGKWSASGKSIVTYLKNADNDLAEQYFTAFDELFKHSETGLLAILVEKILAPYGGLLWEGYRSDAPAEFRVTD